MKHFNDFHSLNEVTRSTVELFCILKLGSYKRNPTNIMLEVFLELVCQSKRS